MNSVEAPDIGGEERLFDFPFLETEEELDSAFEIAQGGEDLQNRFDPQYVRMLRRWGKSKAGRKTIANYWNISR